MNVTPDWSAKDFYENIAKHWDATRPEYTTAVIEKLACILEGAVAVLDVGCGTGLLCRRLAEKRPTATIHGIDISPEMIDQARVNCPTGTFEAADVAELGPACFDAVVSKDVFNHIKDIRQALIRLDAHLNAGGVFVVANRDRGGGVREAILSGLRELGYDLSEEHHDFAPTAHEIESFVGALEGFTEPHRQAVRRWLQTPGDYYIITGHKPPQPGESEV